MTSGREESPQEAVEMAMSCVAPVKERLDTLEMHEVSSEPQGRGGKKHMAWQLVGHHYSTDAETPLEKRMP